MINPLAKDQTTGPITTTGVQDLSRKYHEMWGLTSGKSIKKAATKALRKGSTILRKAYKDAAPNGPPKKEPNHTKMRKASRQKVRRPLKRKKSFAKVGYNVGLKGKGDARRSHHAHLVSTGTKERVTKSGRRTGRVKPSHKIGLKVSQSYPLAIKAIEAEFKAYIINLMN